MPTALPEPRAIQCPVAQSAINFSEGRNQDVIEAIVLALGSDSEAVLADWSADPDHNRMVATLLGPPEALIRAILNAAALAVERIDLRLHAGAHPRMGAMDVVPIVPIRGVTMVECVIAANSLGERLARALNLPAYLYEHSARPGGRAVLPEVRKGGFEGLFTEPLTGPRAPDFGPNEPHPTAGAVVVGAREPLVACNINLETNEVAVARRIAALIRSERETDPTLFGVRALGLMSFLRIVWRRCSKRKCPMLRHCLWR